MKILVTGSTGQLGKEIRTISSGYVYNWVFSNRKDFDLSKIDKIDSYLDEINPDFIINCAAFTKVDKAENENELADTINHKSIKHIANWCNINDCKLIHISSDYVYNQTSCNFIDENCETNPLNIYGKTKLLGELACIKYNPKSIILRTSWMYSEYGNNFVKNIINLIRENKIINVVNDQFGSPTYAADLAEVILKIINSKKWIEGIYNYSNDGNISWYQFANDIKLLMNDNIKIYPISSKNLKTVAKRPKFSALNNQKIKKTFGLKIIPYKNSLTKCLKILTNDF
tara:strand:+ start:2179 stop:3036 length:858 start_codon:yes stop_codon:yes gene_type:complete